MARVGDKPDYCYSSGCPMAAKGRGFALGCGDTNAPISILFERPAEDEIVYFLDTQTKPSGMSQETWQQVKKWREEEIARRRAIYPDLPERFLVRGAPVRGASGQELSQWAFPMAGGGIQLENCFLENVLHCAAPSSSEKDLYPKGAERLKSEACCAHWNRRVQSGPGSIDVSIVSLHPAGLLKDKGGGITALPLQADSFIKARSFAREGRRLLVLAGGKAAKFWLGYAEAVTRWVGHYQEESEATWQKRLARIAHGLTISLVKKTKKKKSLDPSQTQPETASRRRKKRAPEPVIGMEEFGLR